MHKKNFKKVNILALFAIFLFIFSIKFNYNWIEDTDNNNSNYKLKVSSLTSPIYIDNYPEFLNNWTWAQSQPWFGGGSGDSGDPYRIEDIIIDGGGIDDCIIIANSTAYFTIQNCTLYDGVGGISLFNVTNAYIVENNCSNNDWGIYIEDGSHNKVVRNNIFGTWASGIFLNSINNTVIEDNILENNWQGIYLNNSNYNNISGNTALKNEWNGITLVSGCDYNRISGNTVYNNTHFGIYQSSSNFNHLITNTVYNNTLCGIYLNSCDFNNLTGNSAYNNKWDGINSDNCNHNNYAYNKAYNNTYDGIYLYNSAGNNITGNTVYNNGFNGIVLEGSLFNKIGENIIHDNSLHGVFCNESSYSSVYTNIIHDNNETGIYVSLNSNFNSIGANIFLRNGKHAIDDGSNNTWSMYEGNYWDNHTGPDISPKDGFVDIPYDISGSAKSIDYKPIAENGPPEISVATPNVGDVFGNESPSYTVSFSDRHLYETWYTINGGVRYNVVYYEWYSTFTNINGKIEQSNWDTFPDGNVILTFYAKDRIGYIKSTEVVIIKDTCVPIIIIKNPIAGESFGKNAPSFELNITEINLDEIWYTVGDSPATYFAKLNDTIEQSAWSTLPNGEITITFYAIDKAGNVGSNNITIIKKKPIKEIGLDYFTTNLLISLISSIALIAIGIRIYNKKHIIS